MARWRRRWHPPTARTFFSLGFTGLAFLISLFLYSQNALFSISPDPITPLWNETNKIYIQVAQPEEIGVILQVAQRYGAEYLILESDHPSTLNDLYRGEMSHPSLHLQRTLTDPLGDPVMIYRLGK